MDGTSGVWKQEIVQYVDHVLTESRVVHKASTRPPRPGEDLTLLDLDLVSEEAFELAKFDYIYEYGAHKYGIHSQSIADALRDYNTVFLIVRSEGIIRRIREDFKPDSVATVFVYMDHQVVERKAREMRDPQVRQSVARAFEDYLRHPDLYDRVLLHASSSNDLFRLLDLIINQAGVRMPERFPPGLLVPMRSVVSSSLRLIIPVVVALLGAAIVNLVTGGPVDYFRGFAVASIALAASLLLLIEFVLLNFWNDE